MSKKNSKKKTKAVLFDLGKVILDFNFEPAFRRLAKASALTPRDIEDFFVSSGLEVLYDGGKISSLRFYLDVKKATGISLNFEQFKKCWNGIFKPNPPIHRLILRLKKDYRLVLISNTNAMHFEYINTNYPILKSFDAKILSFEEKVRKPDARIYRKAVRACRAKPEEIFYIDDRPDLTEAAAALGLKTFTFRNNPQELLAALKSEGILP